MFMAIPFLLSPHNGFIDSNFLYHHRQDVHAHHARLHSTTARHMISKLVVVMVKW